jgi:hypothetical protein
MIHSADIKYKNYIKNKNVIFAGPSTSIIGKQTGDFIDSHDVVIRTNGAFPVLDKYQNDYGKRCDSLYVNSLFARKSNLPMGVYKDNGLKFLNLKEDRRRILYRYKSHPIHIRSFTNEYLSARKKLEMFLLMGSYIIHEVLSFNPKSLYVTGMSLYSESNINEHYLDDYLPHGCNAEHLNTTRVKYHSQTKQNHYLKKMIMSNKVKADDTILKILKL